MRRRRRCDKHNLDLTRDQPDLIPNSDTYPVTPITPPAAFLSLGYKRPSTKGKGEHWKWMNSSASTTIMVPPTQTEKEIAARFMFACDKWQIEIFSNVKFNVPKKNCFFFSLSFFASFCMGSEKEEEKEVQSFSHKRTLCILFRNSGCHSMSMRCEQFFHELEFLFSCHLGAHVRISLPELVYTQFSRFVQIELGLCAAAISP